MLRRAKKQCTRRVTTECVCSGCVLSHNAATCGSKCGSFTCCLCVPWRGVLPHLLNDNHDDYHKATFICVKANTYHVTNTLPSTECVFKETNIRDKENDDGNDTSNDYIHSPERYTKQGHAWKLGSDATLSWLCPK